MSVTEGDGVPTIELRRVYGERGLVAETGPAPRLSQSCAHRGSCWKGHETRRPAAESVADELAAPWIGNQYERCRTAVVLENLNEYGGWDAMGNLARYARSEFQRGKRMLFAGKYEDGRKYRGTIAWTQALSYAVAWLALEGELPDARDAQGKITCKALAAAVDRVAIVQHVKCSPMGDRSRPSKAMWEHCGGHLLGEELRILQPRRIIVLGVDNNLGGLRRLLGLQEVAQNSTQLGKTTMRCLLLEASGVRALAVPHPTSRGGSSAKLVAAAARLLGGTQLASSETTGAS